MKGVTVYYENRVPSFAIWQERLKSMMPAAESRGNPMLWWSTCQICGDYVVCGLNTKTETLEITREHTQSCEEKGKS